MWAGFFMVAAQGTFPWHPSPLSFREVSPAEMRVFLTIDERQCARLAFLHGLRRFLIEQARFPGKRRELGNGVHARLGRDRRAVRLDRALVDPEIARDLLVHAPTHDV